LFPPCPQHVGSLDQENFRNGSSSMHLRRPHAHRLFYCRSPRRRPYFAASRKPAFKSRTFRTEASSGRSLILVAIIRKPPRMSAGTTGRLSANVCLDAGAISGGASRKTGLAGIGPEKCGSHAVRSLVQSLPALFFAPILPVSFLIPPGFLRFPLVPENRNAYKCDI